MKRSETYILTLNCGSSSLKFSLFDSEYLVLKVHGIITNIGGQQSHFIITDTDKGEILNVSRFYHDLNYAINALLDWLQNCKDNYPISAIGHRLVLGGPHRRHTEIVTEELLTRLNNYIYLAPNHLPEEITAVKLFEDKFPLAPQVVCYDTAFHHDMPARAKYYPLPADYKKAGLIRYGFHGLSYESILNHFSENELKNQNIIIAHLGSGSSLVAVKNGKSIDTTMGISPMGGMVMSTRSGDLDPGVVLFLLKRTTMSVSQADDLLSKHSGLKAIAGTGDMRELLRNEAVDEAATEAIDLFCYHAKKYIGSLAAAMGGLNRLIFTGGIGENAPVIRERICEGLEFLGIAIYEPSNRHNERIISSIDSKVTVEVIPTNEELIIARHTKDLVGKEINKTHYESIN